MMAAQETAERFSSLAQAVDTLMPRSTKTSSWPKTPADFRKLGGAISDNFPYGHVSGRVCRMLQGARP